MNIMKNSLILLFIICLMQNTLVAQISNIYQYGDLFTLQSARYNPAKLGDDDASIEIVVPPFANAQVWVSNNIINGQQIFDLVTKDNTETQDAVINQMFGDINNLNGLRFGVNSTLLGVSVKIKKKTGIDSTAIKKELFTLSLEYTSRLEGSAFFSSDVAELFWNGTDFFGTNTNANFERLTLNAFAQNEIVLGGAMPIDLNDDFDMRAGLRLKYIMPTAAFYTENASASMQTTATDATFQADYLAHRALADGIENFEDIDFLSPIGRGFGIDFSVDLNYKENFVGSVGFLDIGAVKYTQDVTNYRSQASVVLTGTDLDFLDGSLEDAEDQLDAISNAFEPIETNNSFNMPLPSRLYLQGEYRIPATFEKTNKKGKKKTLKYYSHRVFFNYTQGLRDNGIATVRPLATFAYNYNLRQKLDVGTSLSFGGHQPFAWGAFLSGRLGFFRIGVGSNNLNYFLSKKSSWGTDLSFVMNMAFK